MAASLDLNALSTAISKGVVEGNASLIAGLVVQENKRHDLRDLVQQNSDKVWEIDGELKLLKGVIVALVGSGDGSTGMVPRLEKDVKKLGADMVLMNSEMREVRADVSKIGDDIKAIRESQVEQRSWMDGWRGVGVFIGFIGVCATVIGGIISGLVWLFTHGVRR